MSKIVAAILGTSIRFGLLTLGEDAQFSRNGEAPMRNVWLIAMLLVASSGLLFAQSAGTINGRVTDPAGAVVPGVSVAVTNTDTGVVRNTVTTAEGLHSMPGLEPGSYQVKVEKSGFAPSTKSTTVFVGSTSTVNVALEVAGTAEKVEVTSEAPLIELTQSDVAGTVATTEVKELPMLNRNFTGLVTLVPGARQAPILDTSKANMRGRRLD